jgi:outer membrane protein assembly factor BamE
MRILLICITGIVFMGIALAGCTTYKIDVQQGNVLDQEAVDKLKIGMTKPQVQFVLGSAILKDPFHPDRWDYVHTFLPGNSQITYRRTITVFFEQGKLARINDTGNTPMPAPEIETSSGRYDGGSQGGGHH